MKEVKQDYKRSKNIDRLKKLVKKSIPLKNDVFMIFAKNNHNLVKIIIYLTIFSSIPSYQQHQYNFELV